MVTGDEAPLCKLGLLYNPRSPLQKYFDNSNTSTDGNRYLLTHTHTHTHTFTHTNTHHTTNTNTHITYAQQTYTQTHTHTQTHHWAHTHDTNGPVDKRQQMRAKGIGLAAMRSIWVLYLHWYNKIRRPIWHLFMRTMRHNVWGYVKHWCMASQLNMHSIFCTVIVMTLFLLWDWMACLCNGQNSKGTFGTSFCYEIEWHVCVTDNTPKAPLEHVWHEAQWLEC